MSASRSDRRLARFGVTLVLLAGSAVSVADDQLPITDITLYRSGVGYFARTGLVDGIANVTLRFKTEQINDILKSMVLLDLGGGRIDGVSYSSKEPLQKRLSSFAVDISDNPDIAELLNRLRGAEVALQTIDGRISGVVLGVEEREKSMGDSKARVPYVNLVTETGLRSVDVSGASNLEILDEQLAEELNKALMALAEHRADTTKSVDLSFSGEGTRQVVVAYVHEMPVWKTSYRLILPESEGGQPTIQGWAIVENTTDEDWDNIKLSLVSGQPVGFTMDLYQPLFMARPDIPVPVLAGLMPTVYEEGTREREKLDSLMALNSSREATPRRALSRLSPRDGVGTTSTLGAEMYSYSGDDMLRYAAASQASAGEIGEVFQYTLDAPVTIERQQSAMLPILSSALDGRRVSIFNRQGLPDHPMRGVELTNTSGLQLMPGPITVFDGTAYAGDAQTGHVSEGEKRLIAYAVDLDVDVQSEDKSMTRVDSIKIVRGNMIRQTTSEVGVTHTLSNNDQKRARTVLIEHPRMQGWELITPSKSTEMTDTLHRFEVDLEAGGGGTFEIKFKRVDSQTLSINNYNIDTMVAYYRNGQASEAVLDAFREAMRLNAEAETTQEQITAVERERNEISQDQSRIRQNMGGLDRTSQLYRRYIEKLNEQETRLEEMGGELDALRADLILKREAYRKYVAGLNVN